MSRHLMAKFRRQSHRDKWKLKPNPEGRKFDWRHEPAYETSMSTDHHVAPLENGDSLHVFRLPGDFSDDRQHWFHEIAPHHLPFRFPFPERDDPGYQDYQDRINSVGNFKERNVDFGFMNKETAQDAVEQKYLEEAKTWDRQPHHRKNIDVADSGTDYDKLINPHDDIDDDYGDIFGDRS